jgi:hypothetical protein
MWSGPRNLSTALMRSFENRSDCVVVDEPLYAHYLATTRRPHPGFDEILASQSQDWREVTRWLTEDEPAGARIWYQKHMTHHLLPCMGRDWMDRLTHCLLIRDPRLVLSSYARTRDEVIVEDLGFVQQEEIFDHLLEVSGRPPIVISSRDVLVDPEGTLRALCAALDVPFSDAMLRWPPGPRDSDGVWARHWYASVESSSGFAPYAPREPDYPPRYQPIIDVAMPIYERLHDHRLRAG